MTDKKPIAAGKTSFDLIDANKFFAELQIAEDAVLLDAACGFGAYSLQLAPLCPHGKIYAVDLWQEGLARLQEAADMGGVSNIEPLLANIGERIPVADGSVDICLLATVLHDLVQDNTDQGALREIARVLKPGAVLAVIEFKKIAGHPGPPIDIRLSPSELDDMLAAYDLMPQRKSVVELGPYNYMALYQR